MTVKMMLLKTGETLISDAKEVVQGENVRGYLLTKPHTVRSQEKNILMESEGNNANYELDVMLSPWMILSSDNDFVVTADFVATICEPISSVKEMYLKKVGTTEEKETLND